MVLGRWTLRAGFEARAPTLGQSFWPIGGAIKNSIGDCYAW